MVVIFAAAVPGRWATSIASAVQEYIASADNHRASAAGAAIANFFAP